MRILQTVATPPQLVHAQSRDEFSRPDQQIFILRSKTSSLTLKIASTLGSDIVVRPSDAQLSAARLRQRGIDQIPSSTTAPGVRPTDDTANTGQNDRNVGTQVTREYSIHSHVVRKPTKISLADRVSRARQLLSPTNDL